MNDHHIQYLLLNTIIKQIFYVYIRDLYIQRHLVNVPGDGY